MGCKRGPKASTVNSRLKRFEDQKRVVPVLDGHEDSQGDGELNSHLHERFSGARRVDSTGVRQPVPIRLNDDIAQYFSSAKNATGSASTASWQKKPEIPSPSEILAAHTSPNPSDRLVDLGDSDEPAGTLRPNKVSGAYHDKGEYLSTQYDLLREDATRPLRRAVAEVRSNPWRDEADYARESGVGIYEPTYFTAVVFSQRGIAVRAAFSLRRVGKFIHWRQSKRLISGTLVALSPVDDAFKSQCILATVAARPLTGLEIANPPEIDLFFARPQDIQLDPTRKWIMVECRSSFFEAHRHTLLSLQHMMREPFPLSEHLVKAKKEIAPPAYRQSSPTINMSSVVGPEEAHKFAKVNVLEEWPESRTWALDESQSGALRRMLTKSLAIVQGPPGTGKTFVSVAALKVMLANQGQDDPPIIVTCQTNHALDQLLRHVAEFEPNFVRLGGRSKDQGKVKERTLFEVRQKYPPGSLQRTQHSGRIGPSRKFLQHLTRKMMASLGPLESGRSVLNHHYLADIGVITKKQAESLDGESDSDTRDPFLLMEEWMGKYVEESRGPAKPDDFGVEFEEEDFDSFETVAELEAEAVAPDDDIEALKGPSMRICDNWSGKTNMSSLRIKDVEALLDMTSDLYAIPSSDRGVVYNYFLRKTKEIICKEFCVDAAKYEQAVYQLKIGLWQQDQALLANQRLIGMTTTGLSKYRALIASLRPKIVLVEEAAETLEAPVTAACLPSLEHLILVGDHQQLRPHAQIHELEGDPVNLNLSLFERMVKNKLEADCLRQQRRMVPEIRSLLFPIYKKLLQDHPSVTDTNARPPVEGMGDCRLFFMNHHWPEGKDNNMSAYNATEARMVVNFFDYLVLNGIESKKITILTFYNGQRKRILEGLSQHQRLRGCNFKVASVDSYQGEENDVVILSLVRNNAEGFMGFLSVSNRVCVALSRAKRGFYMFGNSEMLAAKSKLWEKIVIRLWGRPPQKGDPPAKRHIGNRLPIVCSNHGRELYMETPEDWDGLYGGCDVKCDALLPCGHGCRLTCHPFDHADVNCFEKCTKRLACGHYCAASCCEPCKCLNCQILDDGKLAIVKPFHSRARAGPPLVDFFEDPQPRAVAAVPALPIHTSRAHDPTEAQSWDAYAQGGVQDDDARTYHKAQDEQTSIHKRTVGPTVTSSKVQYLIDVEDDYLARGRVDQRDIISYDAPTSTHSKRNLAPASFNLLD